MDMMRGIAILGIFFVNMLSFHSPFLYIDPYSTWTSPMDRFTYMLIDVFAQGSFYPLFSFLFGYGFVILRERSLAKGLHFPVFATRRLIFLLFIGWIHATFIWHGDILFTYAIFGFLLLLIIRSNGKFMLIIGSLVLLVPNIILVIMLALASVMSGTDEFSIADRANELSSYRIYQTGSYSEIKEQRFTDWYAVNNLGNMVFMLFSIFPMFLIGAGAAKENWFKRIGELKKKIQLWLVILLVLGLVIKWAPYILTSNWATEYAQDSLGGPIIALSYILIVALLENHARGKKVLRIFTPVGKLSFTNYLLQSLISTMIFYSYGFGLYGQVSVVEGSFLVCVIFLFQVIFSHLWIKFYQYGPFEWLWRMVTYWQILKIKRVRR